MSPFEEFSTLLIPLLSLHCPSCRYGHPVPRAELVWAGHEPQEFCHLFPVWRQEEEAVKANEQVREAVLGKCILNMGIHIICLSLSCTL